MCLRLRNALPGESLEAAAHIADTLARPLPQRVLVSMDKGDLPRIMGEWSAQALPKVKASASSLMGDEASAGLSGGRVFKFCGQTRSQLK